MIVVHNLSTLYIKASLLDNGRSLKIGVRVVSAFRSQRYRNKP
jgi:hypothetical protein